MWSCGNCNQVIDDQFDACWNCGCSREGKLNLEFVRETSDGDHDALLERHLSQYYVCQKCQHREARTERISTVGTGFIRILAKEFLAVSCQNCGYTELFNLTVLEDRSDLENFLRGLFGH